MILIPYPQNKAQFNKQFGMNAVYAGKHWSVRVKDKEEMRTMVMAALTSHKLPVFPLECPVKIRFYFDDNLDLDNHAYIVKLIIDSIKGKIIKDDSPKYVEYISMEMWDKGCIGFEVLI